MDMNVFIYLCMYIKTPASEIFRPGHGYQAGRMVKLHRTIQ